MEEASKDTVCLLIVCSDNQKIVWCKETAFLPWTTQKLDSTWSKSIEDLLTQVWRRTSQGVARFMLRIPQVVPFPTATRLETRRFVLVRLVRLWWPMESASLVQRATFFVEISKDEGDKLKVQYVHDIGHIHPYKGDALMENKSRRATYVKVLAGAYYAVLLLLFPAVVKVQLVLH